MHVTDIPSGAASLLALGLISFVAGCGGQAPRAGTAVDVGGVSYSVATVGELDPADAADRALFGGLRGHGRDLPAGEVWLGVFVQARNRSGDPRATARSIVLADRRGHVFRRVPTLRGNDYAYRAVVVPANGSLPAPVSPAAASPEQGSLVLFRVPRASLVSNRPLELRIRTSGDAASLRLGISR